MSKKIFIPYFLFFLILSLARCSQAQMPPATQAKPLEKKELKEIKESDPKKYQEILRSKETLRNIQKITTAYKRKELSLEEAKQALYPLVEENLKDRSYNVDDEIARLEKKLEDLKASKSDSSSMVRKEMDTLLGVGVAMPLENIDK